MNRCARLWLLGAVALLAACATGPKIAEPIAGDRQTGPGEVDTDQPALADDAPLDARYAEALEFIRNGQMDSAQRALERITREQPEFSGPPTNLGILHARAERFREAQRVLLIAIERNPGNLVAMNWLAHSFANDRRPERAEEYWLNALAADSSYTAAHLNLGMLYETTLADLPAAIHHYRAAYASSGETELRVLPWIAEIEQRLQRNNPTEQPADTTQAAPAAATEESDQ